MANTLNGGSKGMVNGGGGGLSLRAWCKSRSVALGTAHKAVATGRIERLANGTLDVASADRWLAERGPTPPHRPTGSGLPRSGSVAAAQRKLTEYRARLARLDYLARKGELVSAAEVQAAAFRAGRAVRDHMLGVPARVSTVLSGMTDASDIHALLEQEIGLAIDAFAEHALPRSISAKAQ
jgi:phage terminase Nu1 subunit (DNA packaging protein)